MAGVDATVVGIALVTDVDPAVRTRVPGARTFTTSGSPRTTQEPGFSLTLMLRKLIDSPGSMIH